MKKAAIAIAILIIVLYASKKMFGKKTKSKKMFTEADAQAAILDVQKNYGTEMAQTVEKMMRLETAHFKSTQYQNTGSAGMEQGKWLDIPPSQIAGTYDAKDNQDGHIGHFIIWRSVIDFANYLAQYIKRHGGNYANWNSTQPLAQTEYENRISQIKNRFV